MIYKFWSLLWGYSPISQLTIKHGGKTYLLELEKGDYTNRKVLLNTLKRRLASKLDIPTDNLTVWSTVPSKQLKDDKKTLEDYGIKNKSTLLIIGEKPKPMTPADNVEAAVNKVEEDLGLRIKEFCAHPPTTERAREKEFLVLNEVILQNILKLDNIETDGDADLRAMRKQGINKLQKYHNQIDQANKKSLELIAQLENKGRDQPAGSSVNTPGEGSTRESTPEAKGKKKKAKSKGKKC